MELRGQEGELGMPISLVYNPPIRESSSTKVTSSTRTPTATAIGLGGRNGNGITQTLDHQRQEKPSPDPVSAAIRVAAVTGAGAPNSRSRNNANTAVRYRECLKNHAASIGGHVVDGCGEFMPSGEEGTPAALKCAACECHRNFHRKQAEGEIHQHTSNCYHCYHSSNSKTHNSRRNPITPPALPAPPPIPQQVIPTPFPSMVMAFGGGAGGGGGSGATESSSEDINTAFQSNVATGGPPPPPLALSKKRFRTKFTQDQKEKMLGFAEKVGWKIQKQDEETVQQFCAEAGVKRQVLKVWMHNNKHAMKKKEL